MSAGTTALPASRHRRRQWLPLRTDLASAHDSGNSSSKQKPTVNHNESAQLMTTRKKEKGGAGAGRRRGVNGTHTHTRTHARTHAHVHTHTRTHAHAGAPDLDVKHEVAARHKLHHKEKPVLRLQEKKNGETPAQECQQVTTAACTHAHTDTHLHRQPDTCTHCK